MRILSIVWFRTDLRLKDNPALFAASGRGDILPLYIWSPEEEGEWAPGEGSRDWLFQSLQKLKEGIAKKGGVLLFKKGHALSVLTDLIKTTGASALYFNRRYEPLVRERDAKVIDALRKKGIEIFHYNSALLNEPWNVSTKEGKPFKVFTPFWKTCLKNGAVSPLDEPKEMVFCKKKISSAIEGMPSSLEFPVQPGEDSGMKRLAFFLKSSVSDYSLRRDRPDLDGTSLLSPYLHYGEISPRQIADAAINKAGLSLDHAYMRQLYWREFAFHLLYHFPKTDKSPLKEEFNSFPWQYDKTMLKAWQEGKTGYPFVDAAMRQLKETGFIHNRARMVAASFLTKDLLIEWQEGAIWFWRWLIDADLANNSLGWQWVSGCGADAAPYFRIFNPVTQGQTFDAEGAYVRKYVPELKNMPKEWIHNPFEAEEEVLKKADVILGKTYPYPIVEHRFARERALKAFQSIRGK